VEKRSSRNPAVAKNRLVSQRRKGRNLKPLKKHYRPPGENKVPCFGNNRGEKKGCRAAPKLLRDRFFNFPSNTSVQVARNDRRVGERLYRLSIEGPKSCAFPKKSSASNSAIPFLARQPELPGLLPLRYSRCFFQYYPRPNASLCALYHLSKSSAITILRRPEASEQAHFRSPPEN